mmetsp:Transcript_39142/g.92090  ORF Transcript_39142/g.92090 Transcript_39142/m.92090 type:complete len:82 (-) Transcript_39142:993-1238(-)
MTYHWESSWQDEEQKVVGSIIHKCMAGKAVSVFAMTNLAPRIVVPPHQGSCSSPPNSNSRSRAHTPALCQLRSVATRPLER